MKPYFIAVFDCGKTNKKLLIFNHELKITDCVYKAFPEYEEKGIRYEDIENIENWLMEQLTVFSKKYPIGVISVTTHAVAFVCVGKDGKRAAPVVSYTTEPGKAFHDEFYAIAGNEAELQVSTATARFESLINEAQLIYYTEKYFPEEFAKTDTILNFPQYFSHLLTGKASVEPTFTGCHTYLWNFSEYKWSSVAEKMDIIQKLPDKMSSPWDILGRIKPEIAEKTGLSSETVVTVGIHDSNSSLLPYLIKIKEDFILNSTGTWCVLMHPMKEVVFKKDEIGKMVFYNLDAFSNPVKTSNFMGGMEFEKYSGILKNINKKDHFPVFNRELYQKIIREKRLFILPSIVQGTGQFPCSKPRAIESGMEFQLDAIEKGRRIPQFFRDYETAFSVLNLSLAVQTGITMERAGAKDGITVFVEGGFRNNPDYLALLTAFYPHSRILLTGMNEATAFGAALLGKAAFEKKTIRNLGDSFEIETSEVEKIQLTGLDGYLECFTELAG